MCMSVCVCKYVCVSVCVCVCVCWGRGCWWVCVVFPTSGCISLLPLYLPDARSPSTKSQWWLLEDNFLNEFRLSGSVSLPSFLISTRDEAGSCWAGWKPCFSNLNWKYWFQQQPYKTGLAENERKVRQKIGRIHKHVGGKTADGVPCLSL